MQPGNYLQPGSTKEEYDMYINQPIEKDAFDWAKLTG